MIVDLFSGPRGWSEGLRMLGRSDVGLEWDASACATAVAAGHATIRADVAAYPTDPFVGKTEGLIASPPCQAFSSAGRGGGRDVIPDLVDAVHRRAWNERPDTDPRVWLVLDVGRWIDALHPEWIALEQVPAVGPVWDAYAEVLRANGYSTWSGVLNAANYGVPQTRRRAVMVASRVKVATAPPKTHARAPEPALFDPLLPWVTMAEALGWGELHRPMVNTGRNWPAGGTRADAQEIDAALEPAPTVTAADVPWKVRLEERQANGASRGLDQPSPTITASADNGNFRWVFDRPATTVCGDPRIGRPGHKDREGGEAQFAEGSIAVTLEEAATLQSFRSGYPWQGTKAKRFEQVGNAVPPLLARAVLEELVG